jgi:hypothetical protein
MPMAISFRHSLAIILFIYNVFLRSYDTNKLFAIVFRQIYYSQKN